MLREGENGIEKIYSQFDPSLDNIAQSRHKLKFKLTIYFCSRFLRASRCFFDGFFFFFKISLKLLLLFRIIAEVLISIAVS